jgi:YbbR domain-containing protein
MRKLLFENFGLKITAILLSILLWLFASSRGLSEIALDVPLEFKDIPPGLELMNHSIKVVGVNIKGQERIIRTIRSSDIRAFVDLSKAKKGESIYSINKNNIKLPPGVTATNITPSYVKVSIEESVATTVGVRPIIIGIPGSGFYIKSISVFPERVMIDGARSRVNVVDTIKTEPLDITGIRETVSRDLELDTTGTNIRTRTKDVTVKIVIARGKK